MSLRLSAERDIPDVLIAYQDDRAMHARLGERRPPSGADLGRRAELAALDRAAGATVTLAMTEPPDDTCRGEVRVHSVDWINSRADLGVWVAPHSRNRGLARRALALASDWLLGDCGLTRVGLLTEPDNAAMIAAARAAGFCFEGVLRGHTLERGVRVDNAVLSRTRADLRG